MPEVTIPTWNELFRVAPTTVLILTIFLAGYFVGFWARGEVIAVLREWLESMRRK